MSFLGAIGGSLFSKALDYEYGRKLQHDAQDYQTRFQKNRHQWEVNDLEAAGLNPLLSVMGGSGGTASGGISSLGSTENPVTSAAQISRIKKENELLDAQKEKTRADASISSAKALIEKVNAQREINKFIHVDKVLGPEVQGALDNIPYLGGPAKASVSSAMNYFRNAKETIANLFDVRKKIKSTKEYMKKGYPMFKKGNNFKPSSWVDDRPKIKVSAKQIANHPDFDKIKKHMDDNAKNYKYVKVKLPDGGIAYKKVKK